MAGDPATNSEPWDLVPGVVDEYRDNRTFSDVVLPFVARTDGFLLQGTKFSIGGFELLQEGTDVIDGEQIVLDHRAFALNDQPFQLRINLSGFVLELSIRAGFVGIEGDEHDRRLLFAITEISEREEQALRRVIRAYLNGQIANADDVVRAMDQPTGFGKSPATKAAEPIPVSRWKPRLIAGFTSLLCASVLIVSLIALFDRFMIIESEFASVTAPKVDILSPGVGSLNLNVPGAGAMVQRDQRLFDIGSAKLASDLELARARVRFLQANLERRTRFVPQLDLDSLNEDQIKAVRNLGPDDNSIRQLNDQVSLEEGRLKSLELRAADLTQYSPCDCVVAWSEENGAWLLDGEPILTLAKIGTDYLKVEALVHLDYAKEFEVGQPAFVRLSATSRLIPAEIEDILLDSQDRPRVGFPPWLRKDHSLGSVILRIDEDLSPELIGSPVDVLVTDRPPLMQSLKDLLGL